LSLHMNIIHTLITRIRTYATGMMHTSSCSSTIVSPEAL
jgi:hypothetical protein